MNVTSKTDGAARQVEASDLTYEVEGARLIDRVALAADRGEFVGLIGPNGAGKSTLLRTVSGLVRRQEGSVSLEGRDVDEMSPKEVARTLALVPQLAPYTYGFTALEVVVMGRYPHMGRFQVEGASERQAALDAMRLTRVDDFADREVTTLSGGERQRVFVARALAQQPRLLLLDEPTTNLDIQYQLQVMELVRGLTREGLTAVAALHDLSLAARYCDRLVMLNGGRVLAEGLPWEVLTPENIDSAFNVRSLVYTDPVTDSLAVRVLSPSPEEAPKEGPISVVHVIGGGGRASRAMYLLKEAGYSVTAGVLSDGDSDYHAARMIGIPCPVQPAFSPVTPALHQQHLELVRKADCVVLADICFGEDNYLNLEAAGEGENLVLVEDSSFADRDFTGGRATELYADLRRTGNVTSNDRLLQDVKRILDLQPANKES